ncbi:BMP family ABC transporter substrate-binding protein [Acetobacterium paludosum]|uniref:BMP family ABC transporter substrate-binding protein n=1 Tax=Acetobacterium paludosum TaxID=52693 RepID=A0A923KVP2_9FIRM|nr:BMP family ABC transporter substrate-binding protein [Acetobacterium paludosum]MBC3887208.1 BMP family ABC transporter substrate-binding protein [Acetobacterium paludosum]
MKKKLGVLMLALIMVVVSVVGCSSGSTTKTNAVTKVGFLYVGPADDGGWSQVHDQGRAKMVEHFNGKVETVVKENVAEEKSAVVSTVRDMVDQGCTIIFGTSYGFMDGMVEAAKEFPNVKFEHCSGYMTSDNLGTYFGRIEEPRYLSGIVAGLTTKTNKIAYIAAMPIPECVRGINAFALGVKSVNPTATVNVSWTNTWYDPTVEKAAAEALIQQGCDVTAQHQDSTAVMEAAKEAGKLSIGYDLSAAATMPEVYMTAPLWDFSGYYTERVQAVIDGTWKSDTYWGGMNDGIVSLDTLTKLAPGSAQAQVDTATAAIKAGTLNVFAGEIKDQTGTVRVNAGTVLTDEAELSMDWFVDNVVGSVN